MQPSQNSKLIQKFKRDSSLFFQLEILKDFKKMDCETITNKALEFSKPYYQLPHRINAYHSWQHIQEGINLFKTHFNGSLSKKEEIIFYVSWFFHDIIYIGNSNVNEEESEKMFQYFCLLNKDFITTKSQKTISKIILSTKTHKIDGTLSDNNKKINNILNDIDLFYLGDDYDIFIKRRKLIRKDFIMYSDNEFKNGSILFCNYFLEKNHLYETEVFNRKFEKNVKPNLLKYKEYLMI